MNHLKHSIVLAAVLLGIILSITSPANADTRIGLQDNTDRLGGDYAIFDVPNVEACRSKCISDTRCAAFTFLKPATNAGLSHCWLKNTAPPPSDNQCCISGAKGAVADLSIISANVNGNSDLPVESGPDAINWRTRFARFADIIAGSGSPPDVISLTEFNGWEWCFPAWSVGDYDALDVLIDGLARRTGVTYRAAYMAGRSGSRFRCDYFSGDTVLYNPTRLVNLTADDISGRQVQPHDAVSYGMQLRRSLPICNPGTQRSNLGNLIDGRPQFDKCNRSTPSGPAWALVMRGISPPPKNQSFDKVVASLARFAFVHDRRNTFDIFTIHPSNESEAQLTQPTVDFIENLSKPPYRNHPSMVPTIVVGDLNYLVRTNWLTNFTEVFAPDIDVMSVMQGQPRGSAHPRQEITLKNKLLLPKGATRCGPFPKEGHFSDHCALRVDFVDPSAAMPTLPRSFPLDQRITYSGSDPQSPYVDVEGSASSFTLSDNRDVNFCFGFEFWYPTGFSTMQLDARFILDDKDYSTLSGSIRERTAKTFCMHDSVLAGPHTLKVQVRSVLKQGPPIEVRICGNSNGFSQCHDGSAVAELTVN